MLPHNKTLITQSLQQLQRGEDLTASVCQEILNAILNQTLHPTQAAAFLVLLRAKSETADELRGLVMALRQQMVAMPHHERVLDIVGTGGDGAQTVNISTGSAILAASCGVKVLKHGNRAVSSLAGSADVLEAMGIKLHANPSRISDELTQLGISFCYAPYFNPAMAALRELRQQLQVPTCVNLLGPLLNPAQPSHLLLGVCDATLLLPIAQVLQQLGVERAMVVHGQGLDELSTLGPAQVITVTPTALTTTRLDPQALGLMPCRLAELGGHRAEINAQILLTVLSAGRQQTYRAIADTMVLNAAVAIELYGLLPLKEAMAYAREQLWSGAALTLLNNWKEHSHNESINRYHVA